jgi:hypothetical protein
MRVEDRLGGEERRQEDDQRDETPADDWQSTAHEAHQR